MHGSESSNSKCRSLKLNEEKQMSCYHISVISRSPPCPAAQGKESTETVVLEARAKRYALHRKGTLTDCIEKVRSLTRRHAGRNSQARDPRVCARELQLNSHAEHCTDTRDGPALVRQLLRQDEGGLRQRRKERCRETSPVRAAQHRTLSSRVISVLHHSFCAAAGGG